MIPCILVNNMISKCVEGFLQQPLVNTLRIGRIGDTAFWGGSVNAGNVILGDRLPVYVAGCVVYPSFDSREQSLRAGAITIDSVRCSNNWLTSVPQFFSRRWIDQFFETGDKIFSS